MSTVIDRALRWMPPVLVCCLFVGVVSHATRPIDDPDDWWHLRLGNDLIAQHSVSTPAHWSVFATIPWVPTEPLPEIAAAYVERWAGLPGLAVLYGASLLAVVLAVYLACRQEASGLPSALAVVAAVLAASASLTSRPQLVSFVLLPVVVVAWLRTEQDHRVRWWLIPLTWAWSLCHGYWFIGAGYGCLFVLGFVLSRRMAPTVLARQLAVAIGSFVVVTLNPVGMGVLQGPFAVHANAEYVIEWHRTDLTSGAAISALMMIVVTSAIWAWTRRGASWPRVLALASTVFWIWYATRTVAVGGLVAAPLFASALDLLIQADSRPSPSSNRRGRAEVLVVVGAAVLAVLVVAVRAPSTSERPGGVPTALDASLDRLPPGTRVFNSYELGGWIAWRHPDLEQYIDGLITPYSEEHAHDYTVAERTEPGWKQIVKSSRAEAALLQGGSPLAARLADQGWLQKGADDGYVLLLRTRARAVG